MKLHLPTLAQAVLSIADQAGAAIMQLHHSPNLQIDLKRDNSPVTQADKLANEIILAGLQRLTPDIPILSEESPIPAYEIRKQWDYFWLIDPIDGTKEFIDKTGDFSIHIALIHRQKSVLGIVTAPFWNERYWAALGEGAFQVLGELQQKITAATFHKNTAGLTFACSRAHLNTKTLQYIQQFENPIILRRGSGIKFLLVAKGEVHIYPRLARTMEWDTAAAQIIVEEAGGALLDYETQQPLTYNHPTLENAPFVVFGDVQPNAI